MMHRVWVKGIIPFLFIAAALSALAQEDWSAIAKMKKILILLSFAVLCLSPNLAAGDCVDLANFTNWIKEGEHTIVFYRGEVPVARVNIPYCEVSPLSMIRLTKGYVCDSDTIMVDGTACSIMTVKVLD